MAYIRLGYGIGACIVEVPQVPVDGSTLKIKNSRMIKAAASNFVSLMVGDSFILKRMKEDEYCGPELGKLPAFSLINANK